MKKNEEFGALAAAFYVCSAQNNARMRRSLVSISARGTASFTPLGSLILSCWEGSVLHTRLRWHLQGKCLMGRSLVVPNIPTYVFINFFPRKKKINWLLHSAEVLLCK